MKLQGIFCHSVHEGIETYYNFLPKILLVALETNGKSECSDHEFSGKAFGVFFSVTFSKEAKEQPCNLCDYSLVLTVFPSLLI